MNDVTQTALGGRSAPSRGRPRPSLRPEIEQSLQLGDAPETTVIRVHGVGGAAPEKELPGAFLTQVAGDRIAGFYRDVHERGDRHVEAYSWGGLTSGRRIRALWVILFPFMLANMAGWASEPRRRADAGSPPVNGFRIWAARLAGLALTLASVQTLNLLFLDVIAFQCGRWTTCVTGSWWTLTPLGWFDLPENSAHRLLAGALVVAATLALIAALSARSRSRYEGVPRVNAGDRRDHRSRCSAAELPDGLASREFWSGYDAHARLSGLHLAAGVSLIALTLAWCVLELTAGGVPAVRWLGTAGVTLAIGSLALAILGTGWVCSHRRGRSALLRWLTGRGISRAALAIALTGVLGAAAAAALAPGDRRPQMGQSPGTVDAFNLALLVLVPLFLPLALTGLEGSIRWLRGVLRRPSPEADARPSRRVRDGIGAVHPFSIFVAGFVTSQVILQSLVLFVADWLSGQRVMYRNSSVLVPAGEQDWAILLPPMVGVVLSYLFWVPAVVAAGTILWAWLRLARALRPDELSRLLAAEPDYAEEGRTYADAAGKPAGIERWLQSAAPQDVSTAERGASREDRLLRRQRLRWLRGVARARFLARSTPYLAFLLNACGVFAVVFVVFCGVYALVLTQPPPPIYPGVAAAFALLVPPAAAVFVVRAWRDPRRRRLVGVLWDVGTFFPRAFHPFAPPCYAERAVPELVRRIWWLNDNGGEVVVAAHSQGSVLAAAVAVQRGLRVGDFPRFGLVTYGSPLRKLYGEVFPAWWSTEQIRAIGDPERSLVIDQGWMNIYYETDYIGGWIDVRRVNRRLSDPPTSVHVFGQPPPGIRQHTGYATDPRLTQFVGSMEGRCRGTAFAAGTPCGDAAAGDPDGAVQPSATTVTSGESTSGSGR